MWWELLLQGPGENIERLLRFLVEKLGVIETRGNTRPLDKVSCRSYTGL